MILKQGVLYFYVVLGPTSDVTGPVLHCSSRHPQPSSWPLTLRTDSGYSPCSEPLYLLFPLPDSLPQRVHVTHTLISFALMFQWDILWPHHSSCRLSPCSPSSAVFVLTVFMTSLHINIFLSYYVICLLSICLPLGYNRLREGKDLYLCFFFSLLYTMSLIYSRYLNICWMDE